MKKIFFFRAKLSKKGTESSVDLWKDITAKATAAPIINNISDLFLLEGKNDEGSWFIATGTYESTAAIVMTIVAQFAKQSGIPTEDAVLTVTEKEAQTQMPYM